MSENNSLPPDLDARILAEAVIMARGPEGPVRVAWAGIAGGEVTALSMDPSKPPAEILRLNGKVQRLTWEPLYLLPDYLGSPAVRWVSHLRWFLAGAVAAALACLAAFGTGGAV
ncbi:hypothetical protein VZ95_13765 [Elstera litoralis]|uniref:Uncharacterized protein n=1 Tax=Elstera litoralis TaxID=552518 RepID=A0A0F3IU01_9PROT|nr:hypothetical protein [Elstera litoralis]KJV09069.1 hypothetical protein VZ95_13765 [Elstera litoralis]